MPDYNYLYPKSIIKMNRSINQNDIQQIQKHQIYNQFVHKILELFSGQILNTFENTEWILENNSFAVKTIKIYKAMLELEKMKSSKSFPSINR